MDALLRVVRKTPTPGKSKHSKLCEGWSENKEAVTEGVVFYLKYLGSTLLDELPLGESYGEGISTRAVHQIVEMAKSVGKKLQKVCLSVAPKGIYVTDMVTKQVMINMSIYRISFCTADKNHDKVFAFIARNTINETMECYAFLSAKKKIAQAVTLSVAQAFGLANDQWKNSQKSKDNKRTQNGKNQENKHQDMIGDDTASSDTGSLLTTSLTDDPQLPNPEASWNQETSSQQRVEWQNFEDDDENLDDGFSRLAQDRSRPAVPVFSTNLTQEDVDDSVKQYMGGGQKCFEEFSLQKSMEDLLCI
ncbi:hypothetical protein CHS0354_009997 [Potamilus streckersoni]|uniref:PID domain-containing protein n=1 Tax=Potamilus streckersoni TaxID=2493646 RepID=A0AAE0SCW7_9BIVA|nr:hypothetical protein CHS0354_009997 [Potamilus streckersoni]